MDADVQNKQRRVIFRRRLLGVVRNKRSSHRELLLNHRNGDSYSVSDQHFVVDGYFFLAGRVAHLHRLGIALGRLQSERFPAITGMSFSGPTLQYAPASGCGNVLAANGEFLTELRPLDSFQIRIR